MRVETDGKSPTLRAQMGGHPPLVMTYDARGNGDGGVVNTITGDHENRVTDYTSLVVFNSHDLIISDICQTLTTGKGDGHSVPIVGGKSDHMPIVMVRKDELPRDNRPVDTVSTEDSGCAELHGRAADSVDD